MPINVMGGNLAQFESYLDSLNPQQIQAIIASGTTYDLTPQSIAQDVQYLTGAQGPNVFNTSRGYGGSVTDQYGFRAGVDDGDPSASGNVIVATGASSSDSVTTSMPGHEGDHYLNANLGQSLDGSWYTTGLLSDTSNFIAAYNNSVTNVLTLNLPTTATGPAGLEAYLWQPGSYYNQTGNPAAGRDEVFAEYYAEYNNPTYAGLFAAGGPLAPLGNYFSGLNQAISTSLPPAPTSPSH